LEGIQAKAKKIKDEVQLSKTRNNKIFSMIYGVGSFLVLAGSALKIGMPS
jgi:hypothetical protein